MPVTFTLKDIPDDLYERLKLAAETNRRSIDGEAIACLEAALLLSKATPTERLARCRALRESLLKGNCTARDIDAMKREGRS